MAIQWFPGHMTRAKRQIQEKLKLIDLAIELIDARVPISSRNPMVDEILHGKPRLVILNKSDLADPRMNEEWKKYFENEGLTCAIVDANSGHGIKEIPVLAKEILKDKIDKQIAKGMNPRAIRSLIVGIPNVGKSTLINRLAGKNIAITGDRPGVTKGQQWIKTKYDLELLDTPGILWPKFDDELVGYRLATIGSIKEQVLNVDDIGFYAIKSLLPRYWNVMAERYNLKEQPTDLDDPQQVVEVLEGIGRKHGYLQSGGVVDLEKAAIILLRDLRSAKLGRITLEAPFDDMPVREV